LSPPQSAATGWNQAQPTGLTLDSRPPLNHACRLGSEISSLVVVEMSTAVRVGVGVQKSMFSRSRAERYLPSTNSGQGGAWYGGVASFVAVSYNAAGHVHLPWPAWLDAVSQAPNLQLAASPLISGGHLLASVDFP
jgi:hypothetical protein